MSEVFIDHPRSSRHTHNEYCDGHGTIEEVVQAAIAAGLEEVGISSHAPLPFLTEWTMPVERLDHYIAEIRALQSKYAGRIAVRLGAEIDYIPDERVTVFQRERVLPIGFDYLIGSVHYLSRGYPPLEIDFTVDQYRHILANDYGNDIRSMVAEYYRRVRAMLSMPGITIVGHLDLIKRFNHTHEFFRGDEPWYVVAVEETLTAIAATDLTVELNTAGWHKGLDEPYPAPWILQRCMEKRIPLVVNSDSHTPEEVTRGFTEGTELLRALRSRAE